MSKRQLSRHVTFRCRDWVQMEGELEIESLGAILLEGSCRWLLVTLPYEEPIERKGHARLGIYVVNPSQVGYHVY